MTRLAIITTHPIQYYAPLFRLLSEEKNFSVKVFYTWSQSQEKLHDPDFGFEVNWDVPLLSGYDYTFVKNIAAQPGSRSYNGIVNPTLNQEIEDWEADAVLVIGWAFNSHLKAMRFFHGRTPVLFRGDSNLIDEPRYFSIKKLLRRLFLRWVYRHVNYALYVGGANKAYYLAHGMKQEQLFFAPHAIDNTRFADNEGGFEMESRGWRVKLGIAADDFVFLFAGKLTIKKDPELLIKAFIKLNQPKTKLVIVGNGELEAMLKEYYKAYDNIVFLPFQNQSKMPVVYRLADMFVLPSKGPEETWGLSVNEAMACRRGVIVSDKCGCAPDLVVDGKNGYIFCSGDIESLKKYMLLSLGNSKMLGQNSYEIIQNSTYSSFIRQLNSMAKNQLI